MIPRILEFEDGRVKVTAEAFGIPEINRILKKFDLNADPYLMYISYWAYPDSAYKNIPLDERDETILFDIKDTMGDFDESDELVQPAIKKLRSLWESAQTLAADEMEEEIHRWRKYLKNTPLGGEEMKNRLIVVDKFEKAAQTAANLRKIADDEISMKMKGGNEMGEY